MAPHFKTLEIEGLRGFATPQKLSFAVPNGKLGSGLTIIVGANNTGKSTVVKALRALKQNEPSFTQGRRNLHAGDCIKLRLEATDGNAREIQSIRRGASETKKTEDSLNTSTEDSLNTSKVFVLQSRRTFNPFFGKSEASRVDYSTHYTGFPAIRTSSLDEFAYRLFTAQKKQPAFNKVLSQVLYPVPDWSIDQHDTGQYFLKFTVGSTNHSSEGLGEGLISLFFIVDALYDSEPGEAIVIDEPELSLHPALQRKLAKLLSEYASDRQVILATHSPYFVSLEALSNGATVARTNLQNDQSKLSQLSEASANAIGKLLTNQNNPHIFGLNAQEVFFLEDKIILVEGQEDVVFYELIQRLLGMPLQGYFFGWGVGGSANMKLIALVLRDLGFEKVVGILDKDKAPLIKELEGAVPQFRFFSIPANDVRTKKAVERKERVEGLLNDSNKELRLEHEKALKRIFGDINDFLS